ncbi:MAG: TIGR02996 domain-containing protein, partial [Archangium sp.]
MSDEQPLLDAIRQSPDDDELRRVYADFLEEQGDARAGLIRLQLAGHSGRRLLEENWKTFAGELAPWANVDSFNRGLVEHVTMTPAAFAKHGERIFSTYPLQRLTVNVSEITEAQLLELVEAPGMSRVRALHLEHGGVATRPRRPLAALGKGRHFESLRRLKFGACGHDSADWSALFTDLEAPHLEDLELAFNRSSPELWLALARNSSLKKLKSLNEHAVTMARGDLASAVREVAANLVQLEDLILPSAAHL